jgi:hypothetical protein
MTSALAPQTAALVLAIGLVLALACYVVSNLSPGGMITPGWIALALVQNPRLGLLLLAVVGVTYAAARGVMRVVILYGKRLFASVLLLGVFCSTTAFLFLSAHLPALGEAGTLGFIAPGLVAYQLIRQPLAPTIVATAAVTVLTYSTVLAGLVFGIVPAGGVEPTLGELSLPPVGSAELQLAAAALAVIILVALLVLRLRRVDWALLAAPLRWTGPELALAGGGTIGADDASPRSPERAPLDVATLARHAAGLAHDDWERLLVQLHRHAEHTERPWLDCTPDSDPDERPACRCA